MEFNMLEHLAFRHFRPTRYSGVTLTDDTMTLLLWNLSGEIVGTHTYRPLGDKKSHDPNTAKYFTKVTKDKSGFWGIETVEWSSTFLFVTEGIFDATRLHDCGFPAIAVLGNNPQHLVSWMKTLPHTTIAAVQGDKAGLMLSLCTDRAIFLPEGHDVDSLDTDTFLKLFSKYFDPEPLV
jgi:hypothetical protein